MQLKGFSAADTPDLLEVLQLFHYLIAVGIDNFLKLSAVEELLDFGHCVWSYSWDFRELLGIRDLFPVSSNPSNGSAVPKDLPFIPFNFVLFHHFFKKLNNLLFYSLTSLLLT